MDDASRIEALEIKCAYLERAVQELSDVMHRQQRELGRLLDRVEDLARQVEALDAAGAGPGAPADPRTEVPPHY